MLKLHRNLSKNTQPIYRFVNNHSVDFDGLDDFIQLNEPISYTQHTISTWVKVSNSDASKTIIDARDANDDGIRIFVTSGEVVTYQLNTSDITSGSAISVGEWHHIVATYDGATQSLYIDGSLVSNATTEQEISTTTNAEIGARNFSDRANEFLGKIDELAIWNRALEPEEVTKIYRIKYGANLVHNGRLEELDREILADGNFTNQEAVDFWSIATTDSEPRATKSLQDGFMRLTYDLTNGSALFKSGIVTSSKSYRVTFRAKGTATNNFGSIGDNNNISSNPQYVISNPNLTTSFQDYEFYVPVTSTTFRLYLAGTVEVGQTLDITNISIKQIDPNDRWTLNTGWSYGDSKANCDGSQTSTSNFVQSDTFDNDLTDTYKLSFDLEVTQGSVTASSGSMSQSFTTSGFKSFIGSPATGAGNLNFTAGTTFIGSVTNVMVEKQKYVATNLILNSIPYSSSNLKNYYRMGDGILDTHPLICDMVEPSLGSELVTGFTNGTTFPFTTFTTSGNNITSAIVSSAFAGAVSNAISVTSGQTYKVTFDYTKNSGDDLRIAFSSVVTGAGTQISNNELISASGTYTKYLTITSTTTGYFQMGTGNSGHSLNASINNVSVKQVNGVPGMMTNMSEADITNDVPS